jgi:hypothetical protein
MSTNRPFLSNFFAAFRAHPAIQKAASSQPTSLGGNTTPSSPYSNSSTQIPNAASSSASSSTKSGPGKHGQAASAVTTTAVQSSVQFQPTRQHTSSPYSRSPGSPGSSGFPLHASHRQRRGSDSSSEGFREIRGTDKWYIGGRTATGEERFYKLGVVKRKRSVDRLSLDQLSI